MLLLVVSQTGLVYTFTTPKLEAIVKQPEGRNLIQECLNAPGPSDEAGPSTQPGDMYAKEEGEELEEGEDDEEEEEDVPELGHADAGLTAQAFATSPVSDAGPYAPQPGAPLFHPGWAMPNLGKRDHKQANIKRRRTQPNLSTAGLQQANHPSMNDMHQAYYSPVHMPTMPVERNMSDPTLMTNGIPMYYQPMTAEDHGPHLNHAPSVSHDLHMSPQSDAPPAGGGAPATS